MARYVPLVRFAWRRASQAHQSISAGSPGPRKCSGFPALDIPLSGSRPWPTFAERSAGPALVPPSAALLQLDHRFTVSVGAVGGFVLRVGGQVALERLFWLPLRRTSRAGGRVRQMGLRRPTSILGRCEAMRLVLRILPTPASPSTGSVHPIRLSRRPLLVAHGRWTRRGTDPRPHCPALTRWAPSCSAELEFPDKPWRIQTRHGNCQTSAARLTARA